MLPNIFLSFGMLCRVCFKNKRVHLPRDGNFKNVSTVQNNKTYLGFLV